jgi:hypothetical protein
LNGTLVGDSRSAIKGTGFEFDQIREYAFGDDIRFIDWKASARNDKLLVKQYIEERSRTIFLVVDVSQSSLFGSGTQNKNSRIVELASVLALVAQHGKDHVGLLLFSDKVELYIPAGSSLSHIHRIIENILSFIPRQSKTDISHALQHLLLANIIDNAELCDGIFITTKATRNLTPTILTSIFLTNPKGVILLWSANFIENGASSIVGRFHSSYNLLEMMLMPDPPSTMDGIGLQFLCVTGSVTLEASPSQLARAIFCLSAPSSI